MNWLILLIFITVNFIILPLVVYAFLVHVLSPAKSYLLLILSISGVVSMAGLSWLLNFVLVLWPGQGDAFYLAVVLFCFLMLYMFSRHGWGQFNELGSELKIICRDLSLLELVLLLAILCLQASLIFLSFIKPLEANDPLVYFELAKYIYAEKNILIYPFMEAYKTGYYGPSWHPPAYHGLLVWSYMFQGNSFTTHLGQLFAPFFSLVSSMLLFVTVARQNRFLALISVFLLLSTPLYYTHVSIAHIDSFRISCFLAAICWLIYFLKSPLQRNVIILGLLAGFAMRAHAFGLIILPFIVLSVLILLKDQLKNKIYLLLLVCIFAASVCGFDYGRAVILNKTLMPGTEEVSAVYSIESLGYKEFLLVSRNISNFSDVVTNGIFEGFHVKVFGLSYPLMLVWLVFLSHRRKMSNISLVFGLQILFYYSLVFCTTMLGSEMLIKNSRYFFLVHPFVAYFAALLFIPESLQKSLPLEYISDDI